MKRLAWIVCGLALSFCLPAAMAQSAAAGREETESASKKRDIKTTPSSNAALALLRKHVESVDWQEKPFEDVIKWLIEQGDNKVNVVARMPALAIESVQPDTFISLRLNNTTIADVLNEAILQLSEDGAIRYRGTGNTLIISTKQDFEKQMYVRVYNVTDLLARVPDFGQSAPQIDLMTVNQSGGGGGGGGGGGQSVFQGGGGQGGEEDEQQGGMAGEMELERRVNMIRNLILAVIYPESWEDMPIQTGTQFAPTNVTGGTGKGRIRAYRDTLVVYNTIEVHEAIIGYFIMDE
jgi:hypothetical protein